MYAMNSSVTVDSATSVMSSLCLEIRLSSRSNGPSKLSRRTANAAAIPVSAGASAEDSMTPALTGIRSRRRAVAIRSCLREALHEQAVVTVHVEVGQGHRDGLADQPAAVDGEAVHAAAASRACSMSSSSSAVT